MPAARPIRSRIEEKRAACVGKRPKSREETPKEGGGYERKLDAALQQYVIAMHKMQEQ
jgi:hypothetical protein